MNMVVCRARSRVEGFYPPELQPGETRRVTFHLPVNQLAFMMKR